MKDESNCFPLRWSISSVVSSVAGAVAAAGVEAVDAVADADGAGVAQPSLRRRFGHGGLFATQVTLALTLRTSSMASSSLVAFIFTFFNANGDSRVPFFLVRVVSSLFQQVCPS